MYNGRIPCETADCDAGVAIEAKRYEDMFRECEKQPDCTGKGKTTHSSNILGVYASNIEPFSDWEVLTMEEMVALEDTKKPPICTPKRQNDILKYGD